MPDHSQFNTGRTYPGRWTITFSNPPINMFGPTTIVELGALMTDLECQIIKERMEHPHQSVPNRQVT